MGSALIDAVNAAYPAMADIYASDWAALEARNEGYFVCSNCAVSANASTLSSVSRATGNNTFDKTAHGLVAGDSITFSGLSNTTGVTNGTLYYVVSTGLTANAFRVATTVGGTALTLGGTTDSSITVAQVGKVDLSAGLIYAGTTEVQITAVTAFATTITTIADATNPKWVAVELDPTAPTAAVTFNQGTATATPVKPALTAARVLVAWLYVPAAATAVDALLSTANGKAKIMDARQICRAPQRQVFAVEDDTTLTNANSTLTSALTALFSTGYTIPANSLSVGDRFRLHIFGTVTIGTSSTFQIAVRVGASAIVFNYSPASSLTNSASPRGFILDVDIVVKAIGASADAVASGRHVVLAAAAGTSTVQETDGAGAAGDRAAIARTALSATFDSTAAQLLNVLVRIATGGTCSVIGSGSIEKLPA